LLYHTGQRLEQLVIHHQKISYPISNMRFSYTSIFARLPVSCGEEAPLNYYSSYVNGLLVALGLIMAIGAQNAFVLAQSLRREHHVSVALVCMTCDAILITAGVFGLATLLQQYPMAME